MLVATVCYGGFYQFMHEIGADALMLYQVCPWAISDIAKNSKVLIRPALKIV